MDYISMLYMDWFIILLLAYMAAGLATYMVIGFVPVGSVNVSFSRLMRLY
ncbi:hypothetical protein [Acinetobacter guillouiae]